MCRLAWVIVVVGAASFTGCYKPSFRECAIACDSPSACPSGLTCDMTAKMCTSGASCSGVEDANHDATGDGSGSGCTGWSFMPTNFDPCTIPAATGPLDVMSADQTPINTSTCPQYTFNNQRVCLYHYTSVTIAGTVTINGAVPVIIVSDTDMTVSGTIIAPPTNMALLFCDVPTPTDGGVAGAGGGGGGHGAQGGVGGAGTTAARTAGGAAQGMQAIAPLRPGCPGGRGGNGVANGTTAIGGRGGYGGGALELSARGQLHVTGKIVINGEGGAGGQYVVANGTPMGAGGGGGGTGGSLLLEGDTVTIGPGAGACAVGGGGGQGADFGPLNSGSPGTTATTCTQAPGGGPTSGGAGNGGNGGVLSGPTGGTDGDSGHGGGGGGGAEGRIRVHAINGSSIEPTAIVAPMPFVQ